MRQNRAIEETIGIYFIIFFLIILLKCFGFIPIPWFPLFAILIFGPSAIAISLIILIVIFSHIQAGIKEYRNKRERKNAQERFKRKP